MCFNVVSVLWLELSIFVWLIVLLVALYYAVLFDCLFVFVNYAVLIVVFGALNLVFCYGSWFAALLVYCVVFG